MSPLYLAAGDPQAGPIGLALVVVLAIVVVFLGKSMSRHLSKVPKSFDKADSGTPGNDAEKDGKAAADSAPGNPPAGSNSDNGNRSDTE